MAGSTFSFSFNRCDLFAVGQTVTCRLVRDFAANQRTAVVQADGSVTFTGLLYPGEMYEAFVVEGGPRVTFRVSKWLRRTTGTLSDNTATISAVPDTTGIMPGMLVQGANVAPGTLVVSAAGTNVFTNQPALVEAPNEVIEFGGTWQQVVAARRIAAGSS